MYIHIYVHICIYIRVYMNVHLFKSTYIHQACQTSLFFMRSHGAGDVSLRHPLPPWRPVISRCLLTSTPRWYEGMIIFMYIYIYICIFVHIYI